MALLIGREVVTLPLKPRRRDYCHHCKAERIFSQIVSGWFCITCLYEAPVRPLVLTPSDGDICQ